MTALGSLTPKAAITRCPSWVAVCQSAETCGWFPFVVFRPRLVATREIPGMFCSFRSGCPWWRLFPLAEARRPPAGLVLAFVLSPSWRARSSKKYHDFVL